MYGALEKLALDLFDKGIILTEGPFKFKLHEKHPNAPCPPIKVNVRFPPKGTLTNELVERIGNALYQLSCQNQLQYDCAVGVPKAGNPLAKVFARLASVPLLFLEKEETEKGRIILPVLRGEYQKGWRVLIIDDVVVMADSKFEAIAALKANGLRVVGVDVLVDWEHGGRDDLETAGILVLARFKMTELLLLYLKEGRISPEKYQEVMAYLKAIRGYFNRV
jgi:orotate phosphoribosyltransferase